MGDERLAGFPPRTVDKVERLLDLLVEMGEHPLLRGKLALHGGTAFNPRRFAAEHGVLPAKDPEYVRTHPYSQRTSMLWGGSSNSHRSSSCQEHSVERSRSDWAR